jgi:signal transduction histidine kinase
LVKDLEVNALIETTTELSDDALSLLPGAAHGEFIQITREILSNIARHARASETRLAFAIREGSTVVLTVEDDGVGFDPKTVLRGDGLTNMQDRAANLHGDLIVSKRKPKGTVHTLSIPVGSG